jgi:hypothetical protein
MPSGSTKPSAKRYGAKLYLAEHEWRMVIAALRASPSEAEGEALDIIRQFYLSYPYGLVGERARRFLNEKRPTVPCRSPREGEKP